MEQLILCLFLVCIGITAIILAFSKKRKPSSFFIDASLSALQPIHKKQYLACRLLEKQMVSHDTFLFKFGLPKSSNVLGIHVGEHIKIHEQLKSLEYPEGELVVRKYTPISPIQQKGSFDLLIKIYRPNEHPQFPNGGKLTSWIEFLMINQEIHITGPYGSLQYVGQGKTKIKQENHRFSEKRYKRIAMIAGGSGITPMFQIIQSILMSDGDNTKVDLLFANKTEKDILLYKEIEQFQKFPNFKAQFALDNPSNDWLGEKGFITQDMTQRVFGQLDKNTLCLSCGPIIMNSLASKHFKTLGIQDSDFYQF